MSILRSYVYRHLQPSSDFPHGGSVTDVRDLLLFPESLGGYFFGASSVIFFQTARNVYFKVSSPLYKSLTLIGLVIGFLLALLFHTQAAAKLQLNSSVSHGDVCKGVYVGTTLQYRQGLFLTASVLFLISSWVAGGLLVWRAYVLSDYKRWVLSTFGSGLVAVIVCEIVSLATVDPGPEGEFVWPTYPISNLVLSALVGIFVIQHHIVHYKERNSYISTIISDILVDSGMILTVALILFLALTLAGVTTFFSQHVIFHIQNITSCMLISQIVDSTNPPSGTIQLAGDADSLNERVIASASTP